MSNVDSMTFRGGAHTKQRFQKMNLKPDWE